MNSNDKTGYFDDKGHWRPTGGVHYSPLFQRPWRLVDVLRWIFGWGGFLWPRNVAFLVLSYVSWRWLYAVKPAGMDSTIIWVALSWLRNLVLMILVFGFYHLTLYFWKIQGARHKYHPKGMDKGSGKFLFRDQVKDNIFRSILSGSVIWTAWEVLYFSLTSNSRLPQLTWESHPVWFIALFLIIPFWRETHFYFIHRLIHWKPLLRGIHSVHHKNPNPGPWSGMAMHPVEHLVYLSVALLHFVVPSHPMHFLFNMQLTALTPAQAHTGFHGPLFRGILPAGDYLHYLHHKHVSCNFGAETIPWDRWLKTYFNGEGSYQTRKSK